LLISPPAPTVETEDDDEEQHEGPDPHSDGRGVDRDQGKSIAVLCNFLVVGVSVDSGLAVTVHGLVVMPHVRGLGEGDELSQLLVCLLLLLLTGSATHDALDNLESSKRGDLLNAGVEDGMGVGGVWKSETGEFLF
jgi:hypothetical protein